MSGNTIENNSNFNSNRNEVSEDMFKYFMEKCYVLPLELKNDIIYCQRAMRDFLKVHGLVSDVFKEQTDADPVQMQRILDELESEVYEINAEQQYLLLRLKDDLEIFYKKLEENNIQILPELGNEYISSLIVPLIGDASYKIYPQSVLSRDNEDMLIRKHFLISQDEKAGVEPLKFSGLDENVPLMLFNPLATAATGIAGTTIKMLVSEANSESSKKLQQEQRADSLTNSGGSLTTASRPPLSLSQSLLRPRDIKSDESQPPLLAAIKLRVQRIVSSKQQQRPPLAPIRKMPLTTDFDEVVQSRMNLRQALRRARKTKQQPREFDEKDTEELPTEKATIEQQHQHQTPQLKSLSIKPGKAGKVMASVGAAAVVASLAKMPAPTISSKRYKTHNAYGAGRKMSTPQLPAPPTSAVSQQQRQRAVAGASSGSSGSWDDSHQKIEQGQQRLCASKVKWREEPREPFEYDQEHFLRLFGLYTPAMVQKFGQRHSKRIRRSVLNASGLEFHYGQQLAVIDGVRQKPKAKPEFLLSPKEKQLQVKQTQKDGVFAALAAANRKTKSKPPDKVDELLAKGQTETSKQKYKQCKKCGKDLLFCQGCRGYYHSNCSEHIMIKPQSPLQCLAHLSNSRCPQCEGDRVSASKAKFRNSC